jgi:hypothetical protein
MKRLAILVLLLALIPAQAKGLDTTELLGLVAMPLAVSAVADIAGISVGELSNFVATLNAANVAPVRVIEVLRYAPVALVVDTEPDFVQFVRTEFNQGTTGDALVTVIANRLRDYDITPQIGTSPRGVIVVDDQFIPAAVVDRVAQRRSHPHGGPPGQLKKEVGVQTGAEIVHGSTRRPKRVKVERADRDDRPIVVRERVEPRGKGGPDIRGNPGQENRGKGQGQSKGKGKGKG